MPFYYLKKRIERVNQYCQQFGIKKTFNKAINLLFKKIYIQSVTIISMKNLTASMKYSFENKLKICKVDINHLFILKEFSERYNTISSGTSIEKINNFFENNYNGFIAFLNDDVIGYSWWVDNKIKTEKNHPDLILYKIQLKDDDVYGFDFFIAPNFRGNRNANEFICKTFLVLKELGYNRIVGYVDSNNISARWLYRILGYKDKKRIIRRKFFNLILLINKTIFIKTNRCYLYYPFDYYAVYPFRNIRLLNR